jgi:hypothetical protein
MEEEFIASEGSQRPVVLGAEKEEEGGGGEEEEKKNFKENVIF